MFLQNWYKVALTKIGLIAQHWRAVLSEAVQTHPKIWNIIEANNQFKLYYYMQWFINIAHFIDKKILHNILKVILAYGHFQIRSLKETLY